MFRKPTYCLFFVVIFFTILFSSFSTFAISTREMTAIYKTPFPVATPSDKTNSGLVTVHVTDKGTNIAGASVSLFSKKGIHLGISRTTDSDGVTSFNIPATVYTFRVVYAEKEYWSNTVALIPNEETTVNLQLEILALDETNNPMPVRYDGEPPRKSDIFESNEMKPGLYAASTREEGDRIYYFINDHLGRPVKMIDEDKNIVWEADYLPFGKALVTTNMIENDFRFPGQVHDPETGLHYNWHRYYDPAIGRYLRPDPINLSCLHRNRQSPGYGVSMAAMGISLQNYFRSDYLYRYALQNPHVLARYPYVNDNPVTLSDYDGRFIFAPVVYFAAAKAAAIGVAYMGTKAAQFSVTTLDHCETKNLANDINRAFLGVGIVNAGEVLLFGGMNAVAEAPAIYTTMMTHPEVMQDAADFVQGFVSSAAPPPTFVGLLGYNIGRIIAEYSE